MKKKQIELIGEMIRKVMREQGLESPLNEYKLIQAWRDVLGNAIASYTTNLYIKNQILHVYLTSPALRQELMMGRERLVKSLNPYGGAQVIVNIIFH